MEDVHIKKFKKQMVKQNIYLCRTGLYKDLQIYKSIKRVYDDSYKIESTRNFGEVYVTNEQSLDIAKKYIDKKCKVAVLNPINADFIDSNIDDIAGIHDDLILFSTNFCIYANDAYQLKKKEVLLSPNVSIIRDKLEFTTDIFTLGIITALSSSGVKLIKNRLSVEDYLMAKELIETVFQTAHIAKYDVLVLTNFGRLDNYPIEDISDILNMCILDYGQLFKYIVISVHGKVNSDLEHFEYLDKNIIRLQDLGRDDSPEITRE